MTTSKAPARRQLRNGLVEVIAGLPDRWWGRFDNIADLTRVQRFLRDLPADPGTKVDTREQVYEIAANMVGSEPISYLEFGVHEGASLRFFTQALRNDQSRFEAFDSFQGLPEDWNVNNPVGTFATGGTSPSIDDPRVIFHVGWFSETLPRWTLDRRGRLVINVDCDLYSSTQDVLRAVGDELRPGDLIYFDELADVRHEFRSLLEFLQRRPVSLSLVVRSHDWLHVLFKVK